MKLKLVENDVYHILNKSIAGYKIFNSNSEFNKFIETIIYYQTRNHLSFSDFVQRKEYQLDLTKLVASDREKHVEIISYCFMPTHFHLVLRQLRDNGISKFLNDCLNSYTRYFNIKHKRKGPLWQGKTKKVLVESDEQLLHLTRYIHLNPTTSYLVDKPEDWTYSSYNEYINNSDVNIKICKYNDVLDINVKEYKEFVEDTVDYQRDLKRIQKYCLE